jgi:hypothetical protein
MKRLVRKSAFADIQDYVRGNVNCEVKFANAIYCEVDSSGKDQGQRKQTTSVDGIKKTINIQCKVPEVGNATLDTLIILNIMDSFPVGESDFKIQGNYLVSRCYAELEGDTIYPISTRVTDVSKDKTPHKVYCYFSVSVEGKQLSGELLKKLFSTSNIQ